MDERLRIIVPSDVFPPEGRGGAAWSSHALAQALARRGHTVTVVVPRKGRRGLSRRRDGEVDVVQVGYSAPRLPFIQNYFRFERLWPSLARAIEMLAAEGEQLPLVIHGQHAQTIPAAMLAGRRLGAPSLGTVRDYWPLHYFATGLLGDRMPHALFDGKAAAADLLLRMGPARGLPALAALPYVQRHVRRRASMLAQTDAVIAVSNFVAERLQAVVPAHKLHVIPTAVDIAAISAIARGEPQHQLDAPFVLYAGKLERNKGAALLPQVAAAALAAGARGWTLAIAGQGALRATLERELGALSLPVRFLDWVDHDEVLRLMARCAALVFPSTWHDPLSRVLAEAGALGAPIVAMPTGGTPDIIIDGETGLLADTPEGLGRALARLLESQELAGRLSAAIRQASITRADAVVIAARHEQLYRELLAQR